MRRRFKLTSMHVLLLGRNGVRAVGAVDALADLVDDLRRLLRREARAHQFGGAGEPEAGIEGRSVALSLRESHVEPVLKGLWRPAAVGQRVEPLQAGGGAERKSTRLN